MVASAASSTAAPLPDQSASRNTLSMVGTGGNGRRRLDSPSSVVRHAGEIPGGRIGATPTVDSAPALYELIVTGCSSGSARSRARSAARMLQMSVP